jgi:prepilin-type processing-associated H-X9-DG protein
MMCPSAEKDGRKLIWGKGYAMNDNPGYPDVVPESWKRNWEEAWAARVGESAPRRFKIAEITHSSKRFLVGDGVTWDVGVDDLPSTFNEDAMRKSLAAVDRHGKNRSNVLFFDGSAATLTPEQVFKSIRSPASLER